MFSQILVKVSCFFFFSSLFWVHAEIQASHKATKSESTTSRSSGSAAGGLGWHLGPLRVHHRSSCSPQWDPCSLSSPISTPTLPLLCRIPGATRLLHYSSAGSTTTTTTIATSVASPPPVAPP